MTYEEFIKQLESLLRMTFKYNPDQAGFGIYSEKMADLCEEYPEHDLRFMSEAGKGAA